MARYDVEETTQPTVIGAIQWLNEQLAALTERLAALERLVGAPAPEPTEEW